jgi:hypothetical protein
MNRNKMIVIAAIVLAIVISALSFKIKGFGEVYCRIDQAGRCQDLIDYKPCPDGISDPCGPGKAVYIYINGVCTPSNQKYCPTLP